MFDHVNRAIFNNQFYDDIKLNCLLSYGIMYALEKFTLNLRICKAVHFWQAKCCVGCWNPLDCTNMQTDTNV